MIADSWSRMLGAGLEPGRLRPVAAVDAEGRLLWVEGHKRVLEQARSIEFEPGMYGTEESAGTNAIGTALAIDHAVQIFSAERRAEGARGRAAWPSSTRGGAPPRRSTTR